MKRGSEDPRPAAGLARTAIAASLLTALLLGAACGPPPSAQLDPSRNRLPLSAWISVLPGPDGAQPCVRVAAPHRSLIFRREAERYHGGLEVRVVAWRGEQQVGGGVSEGSVTVTSFAATTAATPLEVTVPLLVRGDAPVTLEVMAQVLDSSRSWRRELSFSPGVLAAMPVWITGVELRVPGGDDGSELTAELDSLRFAVDLQRRRQAQEWPEAGLALVGEASGLAEGELSSLRRPLPPGPPASETSTVPLVWPAAELPFGRCRIQMSLELARGREQVRLPYEPPLELVNLRVPLDDDQAWRRHLDWLEGIVAQSRRDTLAELPPADRPAAWAALWRDVARARGEDPATARNRHLRRVVAADDRFGAYGRGAESDRGRTLIRWGEPAAIETYADARIAGASWEVWDYPERGRRLFFYDAHGLGDYRLRRQEELDR